MSATLGALLRLVEPDWSITHDRAPRRRRRGEQRPVEQRGHRPLRAVRAELHPGEPGRLDRHQPRPCTSTSSSRCRGSSGRTRWRTACCPTSAASSTRSRTSASCTAPTSVDYLRKRRDDAGQPTRCSRSMEFIDDPDEFARRLPLMAAKRDFSDPVAPELDHGRHRHRLRLAVQAAHRLRRPARHHRAVRPRGARPAQASPTAAGRSRCATAAPATKRKINAKFVFVGAGGDALPLLQKSGINEAKGFGGFPVGGQFLRTANPALAAGAPGQGVRLPAAGRSADVGAAPGHPHHQRQVVAVVRAVRRLVAEVPQAGQRHRPAGCRSSRTTWRRCSASA